jgi:hypothetical protein
MIGVRYPALAGQPIRSRAAGFQVPLPRENLLSLLRSSTLPFFDFEAGVAMPSNRVGTSRTAPQTLQSSTVYYDALMLDVQ